MNKLSTILFSVLFLGMTLLYVLHFTSKGRSAMESTTSDSTATSAQGIAYVNIDTIIFKFDMFFDRREELIKKQQKAEDELNQKGAEYERGAKDYQNKVSKGLVTRATAAEMEQSLLQQQQDLINLRDKLQSDLLEEEQVMNRQIMEYITTYLEENKEQYNYQFILGKSFGSVVLYGDNSLDITQKVVDGLNKKYQGEKKK